MTKWFAFGLGCNLDDESVMARLDAHDKNDLQCYDKANMALHAQFALKAWPQALQGDSVNSFYGHDLPQIVSADQSLRVVALDFTGSVQMNDDALELVSRALPAGLVECKLGLAFCPQLTNGGIEKLVLPAGLQQLDLDLSSLQQVTGTQSLNVANHLVVQISVMTTIVLTDAGLVALCGKMPQALTNIRLMMRPQKDKQGKVTTERGDETLRAIACAVPSSLQELTLDVMWFPQAGQDASVGLLQCLPATLRALHLSFGHHTAEGELLTAAMVHLPVHLESLHVAVNCVRVDMSQLQEVCKSLCGLSKLQCCSLLVIGNTETFAITTLEEMKQILKQGTLPKMSMADARVSLSNKGIVC